MNLNFLFFVSCNDENWTEMAKNSNNHHSATTLTLQYLPEDFGVILTGCSDFVNVFEVCVENRAGVRKFCLKVAKNCKKI